MQAPESWQGGRLAASGVATAPGGPQTGLPRTVAPASHTRPALTQSLLTTKPLGPRGSSARDALKPTAPPPPTAAPGRSKAEARRHPEGEQTLTRSNSLSTPAGHTGLPG